MEIKISRANFLKKKHAATDGCWLQQHGAQNKQKKKKNYGNEKSMIKIDRHSSKWEAK